jgi:hypothetical protein
LGYAHIGCGEFCILHFNLYEEVSGMKIGFYDKEMMQREREREREREI